MHILLSQYFVQPLCSPVRARFASGSAIIRSSNRNPGSAAMVASRAGLPKVFGLRRLQDKDLPMSLCSGKI
ncbi:hypothetical protein CPB84DRAFT_1491763 [Gymnopilus junonius]|uniref:Uncharacterized protein n=1 Tax=Gymnopilus junonius TaxID=109634 RepID=A0A9P5NIQ1_GYMJU|nr:hypothetical protein CPB84DRAFT_1491763 [Gymnopilus junonius]